MVDSHRMVMHMVMRMVDILALLVLELVLGRVVELEHGLQLDTVVVAEQVLGLDMVAVLEQVLALVELELVLEH